MNLFRVSMVLTALALVSRALGLGRDLAVTWAFGATAQTDSFYIASSLSNAAYVVIAASLTSATIPFVAGPAKAGADQTDSRRISNLLNTVAVALFVLAAAGMVFAGGIAHLLAAGSDQETITRTAGFIFVLMPTVLLLGAAGVLAGVLNCNHVFVPVAAAPAVLNAAVILCVMGLGPSMGIGAAVLGTLLGALLFLVMQLPGFYRIDYHHHWALPRMDPSIHSFTRSAIPVLAVALLTYAYAFVDIAIGAGMPDGTITANNIATKLIQLPQGVIAMGLSTAAFPLISRLVQSDRRQDAAGMVTRLSVAILLVATPVSALMLASADQIVAIIFGQGSYAADAGTKTARILAGTALALPALALNILLLKVCYALKQWQAPLVAFGVAFALKLGIGLTLAQHLGLDVFALSTVLAVWVNAALMLWSLNRQMHRPFDLAFGRAILKIAAISGLCAAALSGARGFFPEPASQLGHLAAFTGMTVLAALIFCLSGAVLLRPEIGQLAALRR